MTGRITAADANYPYGSTKDESAPAAFDGTPYFKQRGDDLWGFLQWLLTQASITPSGNADTVLASDYGDSLTTIINANINANELIIADQKAQNTPGGTFTSGAWRTRDLNTIARNTITGASLGANQITLPAGTYTVDWSAPASSDSTDIDEHQTRLYDTTGAAVLVTGSSESLIQGASNTRASNRSMGVGEFTIGGSSVIELQHQCSVTSAGTNGFGSAVNLGVEIYSMIRIRKVA
jgi:hypothetical protein